MVTHTTSCRICGNDKLAEVLNLGELYPSGFLKEGESPLDKAPLSLVKCSKCGLVQLGDQIDLDLMYRQYWYSSSLNKSMISSLHDIVEDVERRLKLTDEDHIVDIGANDGTMLQMYNKGIKIGFDPALNLHKPECNFFVNDYFTANAYWKITDKRAKIITAIAMFYDLPDPNKFVNDVTEILDKEGIFVIQLTDLLSMFKVNAFDNICFEHLEYYTLEVVHNLLESHGLSIIDVSYNTVNGGSIRVTAAFKGHHKPIVYVDDLISEEQSYFKKRTFADFQNMIVNTKEKIQSFLTWIKNHEDTVQILGASTKGSTLLQVCGVTSEQVELAADVNSDKFGLYLTGSNIKVISETESLIMHPKFYIVPIWHFKESILGNKRIQAYLDSGGTLMFPLPNPIVVTNHGEWKI